MKDVRKDIIKALKKHSEYRESCLTIATKAKKYIDFTYDIITCEFIPSDGLCIIIDCEDSSLPYTMPVDLFFEIAKKYGKVTKDDIIIF